MQGLCDHRDDPTKMSTSFVGLDVGTQGTKAVAFDPSSGMVVARASFSYGLAPNPDSVPGRAEQDPAVWVQAVETCLGQIMKTLSSKNLSLGGVGVSGQQHGMVALAQDLKPLRPAKLWCDVEADKQATQFSTQASQKLNRLWTVPAGFTAPKILWMKQTEPDLFQNAKWFVLPHDYINLKLSGLSPGGIPTTDAGDASGTGLWDPSSKRFLPELTEIIDDNLIDRLPKALPPGAISGYLSSEYTTSVLGLDEHVSIPISVGSGDNMSSAMGVGCVVPGRAVLSLGTSGTIFGISATPVVQGETSVAPFQDATGQHMPLVCTMSCTGVLQHVLDTWCDGKSHAEATQLAETVPPGCNGVTFLPFLGGERTPDWPHATGALLGLTSHNVKEHNRSGLMYRAAMEGVTFVLADALRQLQQACGDGFQNLDTLYVVGGGSKNVLWRQMLADVFGVDLKFPREAESAALGAAFQAGAAATGTPVDKYILEQPIDMEDTVIRPSNDREIVFAYQSALERYRTLSKKLFQ